MNQEFLDAQDRTPTLENLKKNFDARFQKSVEIDSKLAQEAATLDKSSLNRSNIIFSRLSMRIALQLMSTSPDLQDLELKHAELASAWKSSSKPPFCCIEGVKYAIDATKMSLIKDRGHIMITVPFFCEFERGAEASAENPNGEESPIQKLEEALFLLSFNSAISMSLIFVNDSIAEKTDVKNGGSAKLFKASLIAFAASKGLKIDLLSKGDGQSSEALDDYDSFVALAGQLHVQFTSCEAEAVKGSRNESPSDRRLRLENRGPDGKLRSRKGAAVLVGMELEVPVEFADKPARVMRCLVDGDSAHPIASFVGDAAYSILELGNTAYLGNLKHIHTVVSVVGEEEGGGSVNTQVKVQNRKLMFSGFIVPFLFPELTKKYKYTGTTQLPVKAFRGDIDFSLAKLSTVQPNVDMGMLALLCSYANTNGGSIDSGPVTIRDNIASSTMTTSDLESEWTKTYGPIFTSAVGLCRNLKPDEFALLPVWLTEFIESMTLKHYSTLFGDDASNNAEIVELFVIMNQFRDAQDRSPVLEKLKKSFDAIFA